MSERFPMNPRILMLLRIIFGAAFLALLVLQVLLAIKIVRDGLNSGELSPIPLTILASFVIIGFGFVQFIIICLFALLHLVEDDEIFDAHSLAWVDRIAITIAAGAVLLLPMAYIVAEVDDAPGAIVFGLILAMLITGVSLLVKIMRALLARAIGFSTELESVI